MNRRVDGIMSAGPMKGTRWLDRDVLAAARDRARDIFNSFDAVFVAFSGGKDSLVALHIMEAEWQSAGRSGRLPVIFRDEELIPTDVLEFVNEIRQSGRFDFRYYCLQLKSEKYVLGEKTVYVQWDKGREHIRPVPEYAITDWSRVYDQYTADQKCTEGARGSKCVVTGIRASESLIRRNAILNKRNKPHVAQTKALDVHLGRIIYDWEEKDVFRYMYDHGLRYCPIYDSQVFNGEALRVSTPVHAETAKRIHQLKTRDPLFFDQVCHVFPDMLLQERYYREARRGADIGDYPVTWAGIYRYIDEKVDPELRALAKKRVQECIRHRRSRQARGLGHDNYGGYPVYYVFKQIAGGAFKRVIQGQLKPTKKDHRYEAALTQRTPV